MRKTALSAALCGPLFLWACSITNTTSNSSPSPSSESQPITGGAPAPNFTVCKGTFALCTTAKCTRRADSSFDCSCDVKQGYSAGMKSCGEVPQATPQAGQLIPSRYFPITSMAICQTREVFAACLDSPCTVEADTSKAKCKCSLAASNQPFVVVAGTATDAMCRSAIWSSATVEQVIQITGFLYAQDPQLLPPQAINIIRVESAKR